MSTFMGYGTPLPFYWRTRFCNRSRDIHVALLVVGDAAITRIQVLLFCCTVPQLSEQSIMQTPFWSYFLCEPG